MQVPWTQVAPAEQSPSPSSTSPLQSLSRLSQISGPAVICGLQTRSPPGWHCVMPAAHTPSCLVSHGSPPPLHVTPLTLNTLSLKSASLPNQVVSFAPSQSSNARE